jgi:hypothetical protein
VSRVFSRAVFVWCAASALLGCSSDAARSNQPVAAGDPAFVRDARLNVANISRSGEKKSHNMGLNCMQCHQAKGPGKGIFTVAGTLFDEKTGAIVDAGTLELRESPKPDAKVLLSVQVDGLGNFFSTEALPFPNQALFPVVRNGDGTKLNSMPFPTISGACNQCHAGRNLVDVKLPQ